MIISYSDDFVFVRIPKNASTTCVVGLYDMGFVNESEGDMCTGIESGIGYTTDVEDSERKGINWPRESSLPLLDVNLKMNGADANNYQVHEQHIKHAPYKRLVEVGLIDDDMPCVSTIRHPVSRFKSIISFLSLDVEVPTSDPNECWDLFKCGKRTFGDYHNMFKYPQSYYVSENATLFNVENIYDWLEKFAKEKGREYKKPAYYKNNKGSQKISLTKDREKEIIDWFQDDFLLWEQSYREFN